MLVLVMTCCLYIYLAHNKHLHGLTSLYRFLSLFSGALACFDVLLYKTVASFCICCKMTQVHRLVQFYTYHVVLRGFHVPMTIGKTK